MYGGWVVGGGLAHGRDFWISGIKTAVLMHPNNNNNNNSSYKAHNTAIASLCAGKEKY